MTILSSLTYSICYTSDLQEDTIDINTSVHQLSSTEDQTYVLQRVEPQPKHEELLDCQFVSENATKAADLPLSKSDSTEQSIVSIKIRNKNNFEKFLRSEFENTALDVIIKYSDEITANNFRFLFKKRFSSIQSLEIDWFSSTTRYADPLDCIGSTTIRYANPLHYNVVLSLSHALGRDGSIQELILQSCNISDKGMTELAPAISNNRTLKKLSFASVNPFFMQKNVAKILFTSLQTQSCLEELDLSGNELGYRDMLALSNFLTTDKSLKSLVFKNTKLKLQNDHREKLFNEAPFMKALEANKNLEFLDVTFNPEVNYDHTGEASMCFDTDGKIISDKLSSAKSYFAPANFLNPNSKYNVDDLKEILIGIIETKKAQNINFTIKDINSE